MRRVFHKLQKRHFYFVKMKSSFFDCFYVMPPLKNGGHYRKNYFAQNDLLFPFHEIKVMGKGKTQMARKREKISIAAIASEIGVSAATVSRAINQRHGVSEENRRRILRKLREYDFHPHYPLRNNSRIAVMYSSTFFSHYDAEVLSGIFHSMRENNLSPDVILHQNAGSSSLLDQLRDQQSSGALLIVPSRFQEELPELAASGLPVILLDESCTEPGIGFIDNDSYSGSLAAAQHLLSLGHRHIVYFARSLNAQNHRRRCRAYEDAMRAAGLHARILPVPGIGAEEDLRFISESLRLYPLTTAAMTTNDDLALLVLKAVSGLGLRIPDDFSVAGFDDYAMSAYLNPSLTTVRHPCREIADTAVKAMSRYLQSNGKIPLPRITLPTELIIRSSTGPLQNHGKEKRTK